MALGHCHCLSKAVPHLDFYPKVLVLVVGLRTSRLQAVQSKLNIALQITCTFLLIWLNRFSGVSGSSYHIDALGPYFPVLSSPFLV
jgi:hypothetical protein